MAVRDGGGTGFSVLDGAALVAGAAVAAVHTRAVLDPDEPGAGWALIGGSFVGIALTSAGPFLYMVRRYVRGQAGYPRVGDRLWALLGFPWLFTALFQTGGRPGGRVANEWVSLGLSGGLAVTCLVALVVVWTTWVTVSPGQASQTFSAPWTNRLGLLLAIAWPVQLGLGMVVIG